MKIDLELKYSDNLDIRGFIPTSFVDWDGKVVSTLFTPGCNFSCSFCFNYKLVFHPEEYEKISENIIINFLRKYYNLIDGICITGGEPTLQKDLLEFCRKIKSLGLKIKLDTNGTNPKILRKLINENLIDYVSIDIKAPLTKEKYKKLTSTKIDNLLDKVKESVSILTNSDIDYEVRTTVIPTLLSKKDIESIAKSIKNSKKYVLQRFLPENVLDKKLKELRTQSENEMKKLVKIAKKYINNVQWR